MQTVTLQELVELVADNGRDLQYGSTTANQAAPNTLQDGTKAGQRNMANSELFFHEPEATSAGMTGKQPYRIVSLDGSGLITLDHDFGPSGIPQGLEYSIVRNHGQGNPYRAYLRALQIALEETEAQQATVDSSLVGSTGVYTYAIPTTLDAIYAVRLSHPTYGSAEMRPVIDWRLLPGRQLELSRVWRLSPTWGISLYGYKYASLPDTLDGTLNLGSVTEVVERASEYLNRTSPRQVDQMKGGLQQQERLRTRRTYLEANTQEVIP